MRLALSLIFLVCALPAWAECPPVAGENINNDYVQAFIKAAEKVGAPCPVTYQEKSATDIIIEYLPADETVDSWKNMMSVNLQQVDDKGSGAYTEAATTVFVKRIKDASGSVTPVATSTNDFGKMYVMRYTVGEGSKKENSLAIVRPVGPDKIAVIHWQKRGSEHSDKALKLFTRINGIRPAATSKTEKQPVAEDEKTKSKEAVKTEGEKTEAPKSKEIAPPESGSEAKPEAKDEPQSKEPESKE